MHPECNCAGSFSHDADGKDAKDKQPFMIILRIMETYSFPCQERIILSYLQTTFLTAYSAGQFVLPFFKRSVARLGVAQPCITHLNCAKRPKSSGMILSALRTNEKRVAFRSHPGNHCFSPLSPQVFPFPGVEADILPVVPACNLFHLFQIQLIHIPFHLPSCQSSQASFFIISDTY